MKKFTLLFITILALGFLGSTQVRGQYVLDDAGYKLIEVDGQGQVTTRQVENKDVPWYIRFNPSSTLAGIRDNRTSLIRRLKKSAFLASLGALSMFSMLGSYAGYNAQIKLRNDLKEIEKQLTGIEERGFVDRASEWETITDYYN